MCRRLIRMIPDDMDCRVGFHDPGLIGSGF